ncbi:MAG TPA: lipid-A-disaccharide synthase [Steroidobacteraceae bacterium]|jgi:lipid-A-disaccharide synthase|nr:lipid-A-disaccharide synthase [Steroidobacteraceae bacterium]
MPAASALKIAIVAGETSGDTLGGALIRALRERVATLEVRGVTGPAMREAGCETLADAHELAVMGFIDPLLQLPRLLRLRSMLIERITAWKPDVFIGIDSPAFNLGLAGRFKQQGIATVQYVSPQIWAWRQGRVRSIARRCDLILCLLPFEPAFYRDHAVRAQFVGHPLADQIPLTSDRAAARASLGLPADPAQPVLALLPGSRLSEVRHLGSTFIAAALELHRRIPQLRLVAPMANAAARAEFSRALAATPGAGELPLKLLDGQAREALTAADAALIASGTATLQALLCRCPMVVAYRFGSLTAFLARTLRLVRLKYFSLPNLLAGEQVAPEFLQEAVTSANLSAAVEQTLRDVPRRHYLEQKFLQVHRALQAGGAERAADEILRMLRERAPSSR